MLSVDFLNSPAVEETRSFKFYTNLANCSVDKSSYLVYWTISVVMSTASRTINFYWNFFGGNELMRNFKSFNLGDRNTIINCANIIFISHTKQEM
jgi:hypothetical protein